MLAMIDNANARTRPTPNIGPHSSWSANRISLRTELQCALAAMNITSLHFRSAQITQPVENGPSLPNPMSAVMAALGAQADLTLHGESDAVGASALQNLCSWRRAIMSPYRQRLLDNRPRSCYARPSRSAKGRHRRRPIDGAGAVPAGGIRNPAPGRLGHRTCRQYDRRARCIAVGANLSEGNAFASCFARSVAWAEPWH
jgi:hypothetical protein